MWRSFASSLLGFAIWAALCTTRAHATSGAYYAVAAYECIYEKGMVLDSVRILDQVPPKILAVPAGMTCLVRFDAIKNQWTCDVSTTAPNGVHVEIAQGIKIPDSGKSFKHTPKPKSPDAYLAPGQGTTIFWTRHNAIIGADGGTQQKLCIHDGTRHPRVFGVPFSFSGDVGARTQSRWSSGRFTSKVTNQSFDLTVTNVPSSVLPPLYEIYFDRAMAKWQIAPYQGEARRHYVIGRAIAIKSVSEKKPTAGVLKYEMKKATNFASKRTVAYVIPRRTLDVKFEHNKAKFVDKYVPENDKKAVREAIKIKLEKISLQTPEVPLPLPPLIAGAKPLDEHGNPLGFDSHFFNSQAGSLASSPATSRSPSTEDLQQALFAQLQQQQLSTFKPVPPPPVVAAPVPRPRSSTSLNALDTSGNSQAFRGSRSSVAALPPLQQQSVAGDRASMTSLLGSFDQLSAQIAQQQQLLSQQQQQLAAAQQQPGSHPQPHARLSVPRMGTGTFQQLPANYNPFASTS